MNMKDKFLVLLLLLSFMSCGKMLETDSEMVEFAGDNTLDTPEDTLYSVMGIIRGMQVVADRTILLGEIRADLMQVNESATTDIKALANAYKQDTLAGSTKEVDCGSTAEYVWICIPNTAARNLTVKNGGFAVPLLSAAGTVIGAYRVWRTESKLKETYNFEII